MGIRPDCRPLAGLLASRLASTAPGVGYALIACQPVCDIFNNLCFRWSRFRSSATARLFFFAVPSAPGAHPKLRLVDLNLCCGTAA